MKNLVNIYNKTGYVYLTSDLTHESLNNLKEEINLFYINKKTDQATVSVLDLKNPDLQKKIFNIFNQDSIKDFLQDLSLKLKTKVSILPSFHIMRNYHVNRITTDRIGWHRDCAGELNYTYCVEKLVNPRYIFGKVGIFFQENLYKYGGGIDVIPCSHLYIKKNIRFLRGLQNFRLFFLCFIQKKFKKFYKLFPESFWIFFLSAKRVKTTIGSPVFFDSRIQHRGSPINDEYIDTTKQLGKYNIEVPHLYTKISVYAHFGSTEGADSYIYDRIRRKEDLMKSIFLDWLKEIDLCGNYFPKMSNHMKNIINPIYNKYINS
jgi:hypothetical protein